MSTFKCNDCGHKFRAYGTADSETCPECSSKDIRRIDEDDDHHHDGGLDLFNPLSPLSIFGGFGGGDGGGGFVGGGGHSGGGGASGEW